MPIRYDSFFFYLAGIIALLFFGRMFAKNMKYVGKIISSFLIGGIVLIVINLVGGYVGFNIPLNAVSAFITGILGIPGLIMLVILKYIFLM